jgi:streptogramin lyase
LCLGIGACGSPGAPPRPEDPAVAARNALPPKPAPRILVAAQTILGARLAPSADATGAPRIDSARQFVNFIHPGALAAWGPDIYVIDTGRGALYRLDTTRQAMVAVAVGGVNQTTRIRVGADGSIYVLKPESRVIQRFSRAGQRLNEFRDAPNLAYVVDFVVDEARARLVAADGTYQQLVSFHPGGGAPQVLLGARGERGAVRAIAALAIGPAGIVVADPACGCLVEFSPETGRSVDFGHDLLRQPRALTVDNHGRIYVLEGADNSIKVFRGRRFIASLSAASLGLMAPNALVAEAGSLYVADGAASRVAVFRISPPGKGED